MNYNDGGLKPDPDAPRGIDGRGMDRGYDTKARSDSSLWFINYISGQQPLLNDLPSSGSRAMTTTNVKSSSSHHIINHMPKIAEHPRVKDEPGLKDKKVGIASTHMLQL